MHTEKEAKGLWCPYARVAHTRFMEENPDLPFIPAYNRLAVDREADTDASTTCYPVTMCLGSKCGGWRWDNQMSEREIESGREPVGYCGPAGKP